MPPFSDYNINKQKKIAILFFISPWKNHHKIVVHPVEFLFLTDKKSGFIITHHVMSSAFRRRRL